MSTFDLKSRVLANRDASPSRLTDPESGQGYIKSAMGVERTSANGSDIGDAGTTIRCFQIPSNARLDRLEYSRADLGTSSLDIAVWYPTVIPQGAVGAPAKTNESALISSSLFATAIAGTDAAVAWTDAMGTPALNLQGDPLWKLLGLASDPGIELDMGFSVRTAVAANGYVGLRASYVD